MDDPKNYQKFKAKTTKAVIIRGSGNAGAVKIKEYKLIKEAGKVGVYK